MIKQIFKVFGLSLYLIVSQLYADYEVYNDADISNMDFSGNSHDYSKWSTSGSNIIFSTYESPTSYRGAVFDGGVFVSSNFNAADFTGSKFNDICFGGGCFSETPTTVSGADFTDAIITNTWFGFGVDISIEQIYSTKSYKQNDLTGVAFRSVDFSYADFSNQKIGGGADIVDVKFINGNFTNATMLGIWYDCDFTNANFTNAIISGCDFDSAVGFTANQLYSTASYKEKNLKGIALACNDLSGWNFSGQELTYADLSYANLTNANLTNANLKSAYLDNTDFSCADLRGANMDSIYGKFLVKNTINENGTINNFSMLSSADNFSIRKYTPATEGGTMISAKFAEDADISGDSTLTLELGAEVEIIDSAVVSFGSESALTINTDVGGATTFSVGENAGLSFSNGATLNINLEGTVDVDASYTFSVLNWTNSSAVNGLGNLVKDNTLLLFINGVLFTGNWESFTNNNSLMISMNSVPEPATYAAIFGALALGFAAYRRRK